MSRAHSALGLLAVLALVACSKPAGNSIVKVTVKAAPGMPAVFQLQARLSNAGLTDTESFPPTSSNTPLAFDASFGLSLPGVGG